MSYELRVGFFLVELVKKVWNGTVFFSNLNKKHQKMTESIIQKKSFDFAVEIVKTYQLLTNERREFVLSKQLLRSGTSIGANVSEALRGQSLRDFIHKLHISRKEANETLYWLMLFEATNYLETKQCEVLQTSCEEVLKLLTSIIKTSERKLGEL